MKIRAILILLTISFTISAQNKTKPFGIIDIDELTMTEYALDKEAKAVILFDRGESYFFDTDNGYDIRFTRHKRIKIFDKSAISFAEINIPYYVDGYGRTEIIKEIKATTYNYSNGITKKQDLDPSTIYDEKLSENWRNKKFVFPNVQEGSVLDVEYVLETPFHFNLPDWTFQDKIPTMYSEYQVSMIPFYEYIFIAQGLDNFDYHNSVVSSEKRTWGTVSDIPGQQNSSGIQFQDYVHTYAKVNVPAFEDESYITSINDYIMKLDFQLSKFYSPNGNKRDIMTTWGDLNNELLKHDNFGKYIKGCRKYAKKILSDELKIDDLNPQQKAYSIIEYVKDNFTWNEINSKYAFHSPKEFFELKSGNSAEINLFLIAMLEESDISNSPVVLSTRNHGKISTDYPFNHFTNYVVALVNTDKPFLTDATENHLPADRLPPRCVNGAGLIVNDEKESNWVKLSTSTHSITKHQISMKINPEELKSDIQVSLQSTEYSAYYYREQFKNNTSDLEENFESNFKEIEKLETFNFENNKAPYSIVFSAKNELEEIAGNIILKPFSELSIEKNRLTQKTRTYPVDLVYASSKEFDISVSIPDNYKLSSPPEQFNLNNDLVEIKVESNITDNLLKIEGTYTFKKPVYRSEEYARLKAYIDYIVKYFNQEIILEKV